MKNTFLMTIAATVLMVSCGEKQSEKQNSESATATTTTLDASAGSEKEGAEQSESFDEQKNKAVLLWNSGTYSAPSTKEGKWVASYQFGNTLTLTGESKENESEKRTYVEVIGPDGKNGWINQTLLATQASVAVVTGDISLYKNPDVMSVSSDKLKLGDIVAVSNQEKEGFREVVGKEKKIKGFVNNSSKISSDPIDLKVAVLYSKAMLSKSKEEQITALTAITNDETNMKSKLYSQVTSQLDQLTAPAESDMIDEEVDIPAHDVAE